MSGVYILKNSLAILNNYKKEWTIDQYITTKRPPEYIFEKKNNKVVGGYVLCYHLFKIDKNMKL